MKHFIINLTENDVSNYGTKRLINSSKNVENPFILNKFRAIKAEDAYKFLSDNDISWNWPWKESAIDLHTGLTMVPYPTKNPAARIACFASHYSLWKQCANDSESYLILEHDAEFIKKLDINEIKDGMILGINDPMGATRKAATFKNIINNRNDKYQTIPKIDSPNIPQGLAGNSAYIITPKAAKRVIQTVKEIGAWPNDALLCYQNFSFLRVSKTFYTKVQGLPSTTTL